MISSRRRFGSAAGLAFNLAPLCGEGGFLNKVGASRAHGPKPFCGKPGFVNKRVSSRRRFGSAAGLASNLAPLGGEGGLLNKVGASRAHRPKPFCGEVGS